MAVRKHPLSGDPILFAPGRAGRPNAFGRGTSAETCPFCPGNERETPPEIMRVGDPWRVRVVPNKYPAVDGHEVIIESNAHEQSFEDLAHAADVIATYVDRYRAHSEAAYVALFKNSGVVAGASIDHIHSQLKPLTFVPPRVERELAGLIGASSCPLCKPPGTVIDENESFVRFTPDASQHAYEQWIVPKRHQASISSMSSAEITALADILQAGVRGARRIAPGHNVLFINFPPHDAAHFYIDLFPRQTSIAGFELAGGMFIDIIDPVAAATRLR
jgi:UDPglucose--hexose-1-phosphate uridylyltransferase